MKVKQKTAAGFPLSVCQSNSASSPTSKPCGLPLNPRLHSPGLLALPCRTTTRFRLFCSLHCKNVSVLCNKVNLTHQGFWLQQSRTKPRSGLFSSPNKLHCTGQQYNLLHYTKSNCRNSPTFYVAQFKQRWRTGENSRIDYTVTTYTAMKCIPV